MMSQGHEFDKFTKRCKRVLQLATDEARAFNHPYIGTEHLLLGMIAEREGVAGRVLDDLGVKLPQARHAVQFIVGVGEGQQRRDQDLTARAKKVIEYAIDEAAQLNHRYIGTEHLLLGLARLHEGVASGVLEMLGVQLETVRVATLALLQSGPYSPRWESIAGSAAPAPFADIAIRCQLALIHNKFTKPAWMVLVGACLAARNAKMNEIDPEFLLLGLAQDINGIAGQVLDPLGITYERVVQTLVKATEGSMPSRDVQLSERTKQTIVHATEAALLANSAWIGTEHLLLGVCHDVGVAELLTQLGTSPEQVRAEVLRMMKSQE